jgi:hypothetical protein
MVHPTVAMCMMKLKIIFNEEGYFSLFSVLHSKVSFHSISRFFSFQELGTKLAGVGGGTDSGG